MATGTSSANNTPMATPTHNFFRGGVNKIARTITLQVAGMDDMVCAVAGHDLKCLLSRLKYLATSQPPVRP